MEEETLRQRIENELTKKAKGTYLCVNLVCKKLESVGRDDAITTVQDSPHGLPSLYLRSFHQLRMDGLSDIKGCMLTNLLKTS